MTRLNESNWIFGFNSHIEFPGGGEPVARPPVQTFATREGCASISDGLGNLLFYTDGVTLWDASHAPVTTGLGGASSSTHSAIIVPPAGGGTQYHVFAVGEDAGTSQPDLITHSSYTATPTAVTVAAAPLVIGTALHSDATERLAATSHADCDKFWVAAQNEDEELILFLVDRDVTTPATRPSVVSGGPQPWAIRDQFEGGQMKFSPSGEFLAYCDRARRRIVVLRFDAASGGLSAWLDINNAAPPYGLEFSPDSKLLYYTSPELRQTMIPATPASAPVQDSTQHVVAGGGIWALQLGPNNKIYGVRQSSPNLAVIENPNQALSGYNFRNVALDASGNALDTGASGQLGLPAFTRIADSCEVLPCDRLASEVDEIIKSKFDDLRTPLPYCDDRDRPPWCVPADLPKLEPVVSIIWRRSDCDSVESDDVEPLLITVGNPYPDVTFCDVTIQKITVVKPDGSAIPLLPDGTPSVELLPIGPYCFGKLDGCEFTAREFMVRTRGALAGDYHIKVEGICFEICNHGDTSECFVMNVCKD